MFQIRTDQKHEQYSRRCVNSCPAQTAEPHADTGTFVVALAGRSTWPRENCFRGRLSFEAEGFPKWPLENCDGFSIIQPYPLNNPVTYLLRRMASGWLSCNGHESTEA